MPLGIKPTRFAHPEGHCDVCYFTGEKKGLITCGSDGDVRTWISLMDDDPASGCIAEQVLCILSKGEKIYAGNDNNSVQVLVHDNFSKAGILTSFSSAVSAIASNANSKLIVSGGMDFRIKVSHVDSLQTTELTGHEAPILGLSLDPKEEYVASSSADGSIRVWNIKNKTTAHTFSNVIPKGNSFYTAKVYGTPVFEPIEGKCLAYPHEKEIIVVNRDTWTEAFRLKYSSLKADFNICKFSECGKLLAASSLYGEIVVWSVEDQSTVGYISHPNDAKITAIAWNPERSNEIAFCDAMGQLGCVDVDWDQKKYEAPVNDDDNIVPIDNYIDQDDEDDENVFSISKIKTSVEDDDRSSVSSVSVKKYESRPFEIKLQEPFQPTSTPSHLMSHHMVWNDVGIVKQYKSENELQMSSIEIEFHDAAIYHSMRITNYLNHTMAALSTQALVLSCPSSDEHLSKVVVLALQGWGGGSKEWTTDLPENEESLCVAAGDNFVAVATSRCFLRLFTIGGVQREILAIPGPVVTMNALKNYLVVVYHSGIVGSKDQSMELMWIRINGRSLRNQTLSVPLSPESKLRWVGFTDTFVPAVYDTDDILKIYNQKGAFWNVACDMKSLLSGPSDHYFMISVSNGNANAIICKGSYYPVTSPKPVPHSVSLVLPMCEPEDNKSKIEAKLFDSGEEDAAILELIDLSCRGKNLEYRIVDVCQNFSTRKVIELAIRIAARFNKQSLVKKLQDIAESKYSDELEEIKKDDEDAEIFGNVSEVADEREDVKEEKIPTISLAPNVKTCEFDLKPLPFSNPRRSNPFLKTKNSTKISALEALGTREVPSPKPASPLITPKLTPMNKKNVKGTSKKPETKKKSFLPYLQSMKEKLQKEYPEKSAQEISKLAFAKFKEEENMNDSVEEPETKKRKREEEDTEMTNGSPNIASTKLANFVRKS